MPFLLDDDSSGPDGSPSFLRRKSSFKSTSVSSFDSRKEAVSNTMRHVDHSSRQGNAAHKLQTNGFRIDSSRPGNIPIEQPLICMDHRRVSSHAGGNKGIDFTEILPFHNLIRISCLMKSLFKFISIIFAAVDSSEFSDYVFVPDSPLDVSAPSASLSKPRLSPTKSELPLPASLGVSSRFSALVPIVSPSIRYPSGDGTLDSQSSATPGTSQGSMDTADYLEQPSSDSITRLKSLQECAASVKELVNEMVYIQVFTKVAYVSVCF